MQEEASKTASRNSHTKFEESRCCLRVNRLGVSVRRLRGTSNPWMKEASNSSSRSLSEKSNACFGRTELPVCLTDWLLLFMISIELIVGKEIIMGTTNYIRTYPPTYLLPNLAKEERNLRSIEVEDKICKINIFLILTSHLALQWRLRHIQLSMDWTVEMP